ncbi:class I SAM-dependent DNA methyltransferase [Zavarzinia aquatilis]|uniref:class I SAM-dependent DNA methyltransferase n=1 Tax=Zavarzinia aquatilis TaxID=2211142 RepID=UPI001057D440|nr:DNA methyltransferase [Zavarzinia aquatilis]
MDELSSDAGAARIEAFIAAWGDSGGGERANFQSFVRDLCDLLDLPRPQPFRADNRLNDYVFERPVTFHHPDGSHTPGFIDLYKRGCFVIEGKQSAKRQAMAADPGATATARRGTAWRGTRGWDSAMLNARRQAEDYAKALPGDHGWPPILAVIDVGHVIELYADFSGQGKNYAQFPDRREFRIALDDLRRPDIRARLRLMWRAPEELDPARHAAEVTAEVAARLARVARRLEARGHAPGTVAEFLMRCLITMFAEDTGLLPDRVFARLLAETEATPANFRPLVEDLWRAMDRGGFAASVRLLVKRFNGGLFRNPVGLDLDAGDIRELRDAAARDWREVEPAIFGTLLESALDPGDRHRLGAHYTPRPYVERLVIPTVLEPLRRDWQQVQTLAETLVSEGKSAEAVAAVREFHRALCAVRVLDPACGTGNFLYVAMELMKRLEGEILDYLLHLGDTQEMLDLSDRMVDPHQFLGLDLNPRAVQIADLVLWIGYIKWQIRTGGRSDIEEPILRAFDNIRHQDAILRHDGRVPVLDGDGRPRSRWDGRTMRADPLIGQEVPDETARVPLEQYLRPRPAIWPEAEFVIGNPPFIAGKDMRAELGDGYAEACWAVRPHVPGGADFVMQFWDHAAELLRAGRIRRFGFITTNSITQTFSRRVIEHHMAARPALSLLYAIADHPWLKSADKAAVRIAMTVAGPGAEAGRLMTVSAENDLATDKPQVNLTERRGAIRANLSIGADLSRALPLRASQGLCSPGVKLHGAGFIVTPDEAAARLGLGTVPGLEHHIRPYRNGRDLTATPRGVMVIDLFGLTADQVRTRFPAVYQRLLDRVRPEREAKREASKDSAAYADKWWLFGKPRGDLREALASLPRYIATVETAKHRTFVFLDHQILPDNMVVAIALAEGEVLAILSSRIHVVWALAAGGRMGVGNDPRYNKTRCFDPFPFPVLSAAARTRLRSLGERLDAFRKERLAAHPGLTMTGLYNQLDRLRALDADPGAEPLTAQERAVHEAGLVSILRQLHDEIDGAVAEAYGWPAALDEADILERLIALNGARQVEERRGEVRWLRPEFQRPRFAEGGAAEQVEAGIEVPLAAAPLPTGPLPPWPGRLPDQIRLVHDALHRHGAPVSVDTLSAGFTGGRGRRARVAELLEVMTIHGQLRGDGGRYFLAR